jgi:7-keto-8-aminopelargonate synthetase-like enzyme
MSVHQSCRNAWRCKLSRRVEFDTARGSDHARHVLDFASTPVLGLAGDPRIAAAMRRGSASDAPPLLELERELNALLGNGATAIVTGDISAAARSIATRLIPSPQDAATLDRLLAQSPEPRRLALVEAVSSIDGGVADLHALLDVCDAHGAELMLDETHGVFAMGPDGGGVTPMLPERWRVRAIGGTFQHALGVGGGFISASPELVSQARASLPQTLTPAAVAGALAAVRIAIDEGDRRERLAASARYFRAALQTMRLDTGPSTTHIIPIVVGNRAVLTAAAQRLLDRGLRVAIPDAAAGRGAAPRLCVTISAAHTRAQMDRALTLIEDVVARPLRTSPSHA